MMLKEKRGLSAVVATVMVILITVVAVFIVAGFVVPFVRDQLEDSTECISYNDYFTFEKSLEFNCYEIDSSNNVLYAMSVRSGSLDEEAVQKIKGFKLSFKKSGEFLSGDAIDGNPAGSSIGEIRMLDSSIGSISIPGGGDVKTYVYIADETFEDVEIRTILDNDRLCERSDSISVLGETCSGTLPSTL
jgi:flagellin-like protein